jgi:hypothetical protein
MSLSEPPDNKETDTGTQQVQNGSGFMVHLKSTFPCSGKLHLALQEQLYFKN